MRFDKQTGGGLPGARHSKRALKKGSGSLLIWSISRPWERMQIAMQLGGHAGKFSLETAVPEISRPHFGEFS